MRIDVSINFKRKFKTTPIIIITLYPIRLRVQKRYSNIVPEYYNTLGLVATNISTFKVINISYYFTHHIFSLFLSFFLLSQLNSIAILTLSIYTL